MHVFVRLDKGRYEYRGPHRVESVSATIAVDRTGVDRGAFVFDLVAQKGAS
ncbi:MAG: hypothetical protein ACYC33_11670 [Thermoleophilia bacterium]